MRRWRRSPATTAAGAAQLLAMGFKEGRDSEIDRLWRSLGYMDARRYVMVRFSHGRMECKPHWRTADMSISPDVYSEERASVGEEWAALSPTVRETATVLGANWYGSWEQLLEMAEELS